VTLVLLLVVLASGEAVLGRSVRLQETGDLQLLPEEFMNQVLFAELVPKEIMEMQTLIPLLMHTMPMTTMYMLIVLRTITVTLLRPSMVTIDLNYMFMKAQQVINFLKMLTIIKRKAKQEMFHQGLLLEEIMRMRKSISILIHTMPVTTMYMLIVLRTITVTLPWPPMMTFDLNCMFVKAKQVINYSLKMLMMIKRKAKHEISPMKMTQTTATPLLMHLILLLRMKGLCHWHPIFSPNLTQRTSTRYWVSP
jgi:hypothetical protein